jgi:uncharacterized protein YkwD
VSGDVLSVFPSRIRARQTLALLLLFSLILAGLPDPGLAQEEQKAIDFRELESGVGSRINAYRVSVKKPPFDSNEKVAKIARAHSRDMAKGKVGFGHAGLQERAAQVGASIELAGVAENISRHDRSSGFVDAALKKWLASPLHKKNIDGDYDLAGVGAAQDANGVVYFTQIFVKKR